MNLDYLDFEQPIAELQEKISELRRIGSETDLNIGEEISRLEEKSMGLTRSIFTNLSAQQIVQLARHPLRPHTLDYVRRLFTDFDELEGDRHSSNAQSLIGGLARFDGKSVVVIGHQKGRTTKEKVDRNFGMALFHLLPDAFRSFHANGIPLPILTSIGIAILSFILLLFIDQSLLKLKLHHHKLAGAFLMTLTLSLHAFIEGLIIGLSETLKFASLIFFAVLLHKGFEVFAFIINLHRRIHNRRLVTVALILFAMVTPLGIWLGAEGLNVITLNVDHWLTAVFYAFATGTFIYIGSVHSHHEEYHHLAHDSYHRYNEVLTTIAGIAVMGILGLLI